MAYHQPFQITGFHSCDKVVGLEVLNGRSFLTPSVNDWDWLGEGVYFWEQNPLRALEYAEESAIGLQHNKKPITTPFVIGAIIELGNCLNLTEPTSLQIVKQAHDSLKEAHLRSGEPMKENNGPKRELDCAVIKYLHTIREKAGDTPFDTIRSPFHEADLLYENANFSARLHIEICVKNLAQIKGYFLPMPIIDYNPYLNREFNKEDYLRQHPETAAKLAKKQAKKRGF
jgi:hypothetical protein